MPQQGSGNVPFEAFAAEISLFQQLNENQMGEIIGFSGISRRVEGALADGCYKASQCSFDPIIAAAGFHDDDPFTLNPLLIVGCFAARLTCNFVELILDLLPVHHVPPIGNVFRPSVVVLEIICVLPNIES